MFSVLFYLLITNVVWLGMVGKEGVGVSEKGGEERKGWKTERGKKGWETKRGRKG